MRNTSICQSGILFDILSASSPNPAHSTCFFSKNFLFPLESPLRMPLALIKSWGELFSPGSRLFLFCYNKIELCGGRSQVSFLMYSQSRGQGESDLGQVRDSWIREEDDIQHFPKSSVIEISGNTSPRFPFLVPPMWLYYDFWFSFITVFWSSFNTSPWPCPPSFWESTSPSRYTTRLL